MKGNVGRKPLDRDELVAKIRAVPVEQRQNQRQLAAATAVSRRLVGILLRDGILTRVTDRIKRTLTDSNRVARLQFSLAHLDESTMLFDGGFDVVHVDEKWFNEDKDDRAYLLLDGEMTRPRITRLDHSTGTMFDGKIGLWPLMETFAAQRNRVNRTEGTICTRNVATVDRQLYKHYIVDHIIPAIKAKWPVQDRRRTILIQQDNATPHVLPSDPDVVAAGTADGWNIRLLFQPPNSPDLNVLDLGFFASIQSIQYRQTTRGIENLIRAATDAFEETSITTLDNIFITLQCVMQCIMEKDEGNRFSLPHIGKEALRKKGELPERITCDSAVYDLAVSALERAGQPMLF